MAIVASVGPEPPSEEDVVAQLDALAAGLADGPPGRAGASVDDAVSFIYGELGFVGNAADYYSPDNSLIDRVLRGRRGIPLTLAMVGVEIGRRAGIELSIVGLPGHVLVGDGAAPRRWFDPFAGGAELDLEGCRQLFGRFHQIESFTPAMADPIDNVSATVRMLSNLKVSYRSQGDLSQLVKVLELSATVPGAAVSEQVELAGALAALGRDDQAAEQRELLISRDPERAEQHRSAAARHRARRN